MVPLQGQQRYVLMVCARCVETLTSMLYNKAMQLKLESIIINTTY
jgi:hypothetical protein